MKIEKENSRVFYLYPEEKETINQIAVAVILSSYEQAGPLGMGYARPFGTELTEDMAQRMIKGENVSGDYPALFNKPDEVHMDYVFGRCCKTYLTIREKCVKVIISDIDRNPDAVVEGARKRVEGTQ